MLVLALMDLLAANKPLADALVVTVLPALAALISGWLSHDGWPDWINGLIAYVVVIALSAGYALLSGKLIADWLTDAAIVSGITAAFLSGPMQPLYQAIVAKVPSPIAVLFGALADSLKPYNPEQPPTIPTPRASIMPPGQTSTIRQPNGPDNPTPVA